MSDNILTEKRFIDLANQAYKRNIVTFSDFLTLDQLHILQQNASKYSTSFELSGGFANAERQIVAFVPDALCYTWEFTIVCLQITATYPKFAEKITHRDILGAVMNLGIERDKIGDILVLDDISYLFCKKELVSYIQSELIQIRHTLVTCLEIVADNLDIQPKFEEHEAIISSNRLDNVVAAFTKQSRSTAVTYIQSGKVTIQGSECLHNTYLCKPNDVISIRHYGKYQFGEVFGLTKKNRVKITYKKYV